MKAASAQGSKRRRGASWLWRWSPLVTVPLCLVYGAWIAAIWGPYQDWGLRHRNGREAGMLTQIMDLEWGQLWRHTRVRVMGAAERSKAPIPRIDLVVGSEQEAQLNRALPASGRDYVEAGLLAEDGEIQPVEVKYRGDFYWHWALEKKSWRIKTKKSSLWNGLRWFNLVVPKSPALIEGHLSYWLAREMQLLAPRSAVMELWINGRNRGVHTLVEQPDELLLRQADRMPSDLYVGELVGRDSYPGRPERLFDGPALWTKDAINNHYDEEHHEPLIALSRAIQRVADSGDVTQLRSLVDYPSFARFAVYRVLCQSGHHDDTHNWRLLYDPWKRGFEPLVWDPNAWHRLWAPQEGRPAFQIPLFSALDRALAQDPAFRWEVHRAAVTALEQSIPKRTLDALDQEAEQVRRVLHRDPSMVEHFVAYGPEDVREAIAALRATVHRYGKQLRAAHLETALEVQAAGQRSPDGRTWDWQIEVGGTRPVARWEWRFSEPLPQGTWEVLALPADETAPAQPLSTSVSGHSLWIEQPWMPGLEVEADPKHSFLMPFQGRARPARYALRLRHEGSAWPELEGVWVAPLRGAVQPVTVLRALPERESVGIDPLVPRTVRTSETWSGLRTIEGVQRIEANLTWEPGLHLRMQPGAVLLLEGQVQALGTAENPIRITPAEAGQAPWGAVALLDAGANGSTWQHVHMEGGSGWQAPLEEYTGMLSLHAVDGVTLRDCQFRNSVEFDDMVHAVYARDLVLERCTFERAASDGLDLDACRAVLRDCRFWECGNDGVDLMMSRVTFEDVEFVRNGDKGLSVGERSRTFVERSRFLHNRIGLQVKDASHAWIRESHFEQGGTVLAGIVKNWRYGDGGTALLEGCDFEGLADVEVDKRCRLTFAGGQGVQRWEGEKRVLLGPREATVQDWPARGQFAEDDFFVRWVSRPRD